MSPPPSNRGARFGCAVSRVFTALFGARPPRPAAAWTQQPLYGRWPAALWVCAISAFAGSYFFLFSFMHPFVDTRPCVAPLLDDPLMKLIPRTKALYVVTHDIYYWFTAIGTLSLVARAARGDHAPMLRWGMALSLQALLRSITLWLVPLCRLGLAPGSIPFAEAPTINLGFIEIPWRMWATNDLLFSGHVGEFFLLYLATRRHWPRSAVGALWLFQIAQALSLVATRGHYTIDVVVAIPFAFCADALSCAVLRSTTGWSPRELQAA